MGQGRPAIDTRAVQRVACRYDHELKHKNARCFHRRYAELWKLFRSDLTFSQIGSMLGISRQAVHQLYNRWFGQFLGSGTERTERIHRVQRQIQRELQLEEELARARDDPVFQFVAEQAAIHGHELQPVVAYGETAVKRSAAPVYRKGNRYLRVYHRYCPFRPSAHSRQVYASFQISYSMLTGIHACVLFADIPGYEKELFVVRAAMLRKVIAGRGENVWTFYIMLGPRMKRPPKMNVDLRKFKDAWWVLDL